MALALFTITTPLRFTRANSKKASVMGSAQVISRLAQSIMTANGSGVNGQAKGLNITSTGQESTKVI
jgi:hypothetical protein